MCIFISQGELPRASSLLLPPTVLVLLSVVVLFVLSPTLPPSPSQNMTPPAAPMAAPTLYDSLGPHMASPRSTARSTRPASAVSFRNASWYCTLANISAAAPQHSAALTFYLGAVYGQADAQLASHEWDWAAVDIVWLAMLPVALRNACRGRWAPAPMETSSMFLATDSFVAPAGTVWRYAHATYCRCCGMVASAAYRDLPCESERGGPRRPPIVADGAWSSTPFTCTLTLHPHPHPGGGDEKGTHHGAAGNLVRLLTPERGAHEGHRDGGNGHRV